MFKLFLALFVMVLVVVRGTEYPKVRVEVYYEALCPGCQAFITGPLTNTLALSDMVAIIDLKMVPYGNTKKNADGSFTCQHGSDECISDAYELCTEYHLSGNISSISSGDTHYQAFPFIQCMEMNEGNPAKAEGCFTSTTAKTSSLKWSDITNCFAKEYNDVQNEGAKATPKHDYVPWVLVDGTLLENTNMLKSTVCKAYTGPPPASCTRVAKETSDVCMNN